MGIQAAPEVKFALIREATMHDNNLLKISKMCEIANVSRSGYYNWCASEEARKSRDDSDRKDFYLILEDYKYRGYAKGARGIHMRLLHNPGIIMNVKKIRRLMRKFGLYCPIRKANPYRRMLNEMKTSSIAPNVVNREFKRGARKVLLTDITYLFYEDGRCFLSTILDAYTREVLSYRVSVNLKVEFVLETVDLLIAEHGCALDNETIVHSDQGSHYTSYAFVQKLKDLDFVQSMSRRGNCWDNSPQESFFGHMKDEIAELIENCSSFNEVVEQISNWMDYYNNDRGQWDLFKLAPAEYYEYLLTGVYPLPVYKKISIGALPRTPRFNALHTEGQLKEKSDTMCRPPVARIGAPVAVE
ncbi:MAG: IS3 family transposase [Clostridia bacterium]|nr:IS3 family transposase [Clostridia bacterium]